MWHVISRNIFTLSIIFYYILASQKVIVFKDLTFSTVLFLKNQSEASYSLPACVHLKDWWGYTYSLPYVFVAFTRIDL